MSRVKKNSDQIQSIICCQVNRCFFEFGLQRRTKIVSIFSLLGGVLALLLGAAKIPEIPKLYSSIEWPDGHPSLGDIDAAVYKLWVWSSSHIAYGVLTIISVAFVIEVAWKNSGPKLLIPWLVVTAVSIIAIIVSVVMTPIDESYAESIVYLIFTAITSYCWYVVLSFYLELKDKSNERLPKDDEMNNETSRNLI